MDESIEECTQGIRIDWVSAKKSLQSFGARVRRVVALLVSQPYASMQFPGGPYVSVMRPQQSPKPELFLKHPFKDPNTGDEVSTLGIG